MTTSIMLEPPHGLVTISSGRTEVPRSIPDEPAIAATHDCILVGCTTNADGPTHITLDHYPPAKPSSHHIFDGWIDTPNCTVAVWTIYCRKLLETKVPTTRTRVRVWVSRLNSPDEVMIAVG
jgi:hypothetical protein